MKLVTIKTFAHHSEAQLARQLLDQNGIKSTVMADDGGGWAPYLGGIRDVILRVNESDAKKALEILGAP